MEGSQYMIETLMRVIGIQSSWDPPKNIDWALGLFPMGVVEPTPTSNGWGSRVSKEWRAGIESLVMRMNDGIKGSKRWDGWDLGLQD
ncbi:hypothetical protein AMTR_s00039p00214980 [Amborella trichopoda]|uniref:Uncharacterized protein n=1 Tax=Amborella trichopoda TaxID=13333 RepID=U5D0E3_AMBTC|nr:hypothetical protein AMTR_s00039p00214980 [Amborella trichopoda]